MTKLQQFFYDNAGYSYDPATETLEQGRIAGAIRLAEAEAYAVEQGWFCEWEADEVPCQHGEDGEDHEAECCTLYPTDGIGGPLASLCGICGATPEYRRVVEAELALEAMRTHLKA